jgi:tripartite-type tricarboxylate transporter receptor subunit TctC
MRYCDDLPMRRPGRGGRAEQAVCVMRRRRLLMLGAAVGLLPPLAMAQQFPSRPIRLVNGFAVGGGVDYAVRLIAPALGEELKGTMVVENKVGASGMIAAHQVANSPPDGYTLMITGGSAVMIAPQTVAKATFNPLADLVPINSVGGSPLASPSTPAWASAP